MQQLLRFAMRLELDFGVAGVVVGLGNLVALQEIGAAFKLHDDVVALVTAFDLAHAAAEHGLAMVDEADGVAQLLHLIHAVRGEKNGFAARLEFEQRILQQRGVHGIEAAEGLVHHHQIGIVEQRGNELDLLLHTLGELLRLHCESVGDLHARSPINRPPAGIFLGHAVQLAEEDELVQHFHFLVKAALLGQIADAIEASAVEGLFEKINAPRIGQRDAHHHADGAGFSGSIGAQQAKHLAGIDGKAEVAHGDFAFVSLGDSRELNDWHDGSCGGDGGLDAWWIEPKRQEKCSKGTGYPRSQVFTKRFLTVTRMWVGKRSIYALFERRGSVKQIQQEHSSED